jgi:hypothetical protein
VKRVDYCRPWYQLEQIKVIDCPVPRVPGAAGGGWCKYTVLLRHAEVRLLRRKVMTRVLELRVLIETFL